MGYEVVVVRPLLRSSHPEMFLGQRVLKICSKFTGEHPKLKLRRFEIFCEFSEHFFLRKSLNGCFWLLFIIYFDSYLITWWKDAMLQLGKVSITRIRHLNKLLKNNLSKKQYYCQLSWLTSSDIIKRQAYRKIKQLKFYVEI